MPDIAEDRATQSLKKRGSMSSLSSHEFRRKDLHGRTKDSMSTVSYMDEPSQRDDVSRLTVQMENTYQLGCLPVGSSRTSCLHQPTDTSCSPGTLFHLMLLGSSPTKHFPAVTVNHILKDVLTNYLQEEAYEPELCRQMTKTISEVIKARVKDFILPRYKLIVIIHIGQLSSQSIFIGSRCLWDPKNDAVSSYVFRNSSLFAVANVYAVYFE